MTDRFRLSRAGILNVWQYDDQVFDFADGRLLLRGTNGAGKSKTLEMLLPFALDGDKARITASAKHHTSLLWLMTDGLESGNRIGYVWVEFARVGADGAPEHFTCGVGIRASTTARSATAWHFATDRRVGKDFSLEDDAGPLSAPRLADVLGAQSVFDKAAEYKAHVGRELFGLAPAQFEEVLRLLYWLRQPQVGEDIEPDRLARQLAQALPQLDEQALSTAGATFDELAAFGEQISRRAAAAQALVALADAFGAYARAVVAERAVAVREALRTERRLRSSAKAAEAEHERVSDELGQATDEQAAEESGMLAARAALSALEASPEARSQEQLAERERAARDDARAAGEADARLARQGALVERSEQAAENRRASAEGGIRQVAQRLRGIGASDDGVPTVVVPALLVDLVLADAQSSADVDAALDASGAAIERARTEVSARLAGVGVVNAALDDLEKRQAEAGHSAQAADHAEQRWEAARAARLAADGDAAARHDGLVVDVRAWLAAPEASPDAQGEAVDAGSVTVPDELDEAFVNALPGLARSLAAPGLEHLRAERASAQASEREARALIDELGREREAVAAERDPAPPPPVLPRTARTDGRALWQVVDFVPGLGEPERAGLEAALESAGLLDAWVRPGGRLLDAEHRDVVVSGGTARARGLAQVLVPDLPEGCDLTSGDVAAVLAAIGSGPEGDDVAWASVDGSWRLGPAHGRAAKERAQYIGATARQAERERRLRLLDERLAQAHEQLATAVAAAETLAARIGALEAWVAAVPDGGALLKAWVIAGERSQAEARDADANEQAQRIAHEARQRVASARAALDDVAAVQHLPADRIALAAIEQRLREAQEQLRDCGHQLPRLHGALTSWREAAADLDAALASLAIEQQATDAARQRADESQARFTALRDSLGDSIVELRRKIGEAEQAERRHRDAATAARERAGELRELRGAASANAQNTAAQLAEHLQQRAEILALLVTLADVPGLLDAAGVEADHGTQLRGLAGHPAGEAIPRALASIVEALAGLSTDASHAAGDRVWRVFGDAVAGPGADHQPAIVKHGDVLTVIGRDEGGEATVHDLARRVVAAVEHDRALLTERERARFEEHILGELGEAIRQRRRDAEELVAAMTDQLGHVTTSQGIRVRLDWKLRDDVPPEVRAAVELLAQPVGALIPEERAQLRDVLHRLIEASRLEHPELSYREHLEVALDYRTWSAFTIRYQRPEKPGAWERLHRRSALSQGEQKVLCYLPLFAAAAAHFSSLAGAAPYAPRFILLDDAFPKIDVRTHPLLFGLLVDLDLDFVITSERLWGDFAEVPSLAIYEALRDPGQRGIAQYEYRWDGRVLRDIG